MNPSVAHSALWEHRELLDVHETASAPEDGKRENRNMHTAKKLPPRGKGKVC